MLYRSAYPTRSPNSVLLLHTQKQERDLQTVYYCCTHRSRGSSWGYSIPASD